VKISYEDTVEGNQVKVEIVGGMAAPPPEGGEPSDKDNGDKEFGWYVICNGRIVLAADKTTVSGWGTENWPQWHRQYSGFIGVILFTAANATILPMTTTKRSVDQSSVLYRKARPKMRDITKEWIAYTNLRKQVIDEAKRVESSSIKSVKIYDVKPSESIKLPKFADIQQQKERLANISYSVPIGKLKQLAKEFGNINMSQREVGLKSFDYTYDDMVGDN
jgi:hypothetical protein